MPWSKSLMSRWRTAPNGWRIALTLAIVLLAVGVDVAFRQGKALLPIAAAWLSQAILDALRDFTKEAWRKRPHRPRQKKPIP